MEEYISVKNEREERPPLADITTTFKTVRLYQYFTGMDRQKISKAE